MNLFRFAYPDLLYLLLAVPLIIAVWIFDYLRRKRNRRRIGEESLVAKLMPDYSPARPVVKLILSIAAYSILVLAVSRPQFGSKIEEVKRKGVEVIIALDVSNSMLADDIQPSRLERAKQAISRLVENLTDDKIGLIIFAGDAYTQIPVTTDYISAKIFLSTISPSSVSKQGTSVEAAISLAMKSFTPGSNRSRALIIITDGESHDDDPVAVAQKAAQEGITVHAIGIGSPDGKPIRITEGGRTDFLKDSEGNTVISKLDEKTLMGIAGAAGGKYVRAASSNIGLEQIYSEIRKMKDQELEASLYTEYNDQFQIFCALALLLLVIDFVIMDRKNRKLEKLRIFRKRGEF